MWTLSMRCLIRFPKGHVEQLAGYKRLECREEVWAKAIDFGSAVI